MMAEKFPWLTAIVVEPILASLLIPLIPDKGGKSVRWYALGVGLLDFVLMSYVFWRYYEPTNSGWQLQESYSWIEEIGLSWAVGVDGISMPLVLLAGFVTNLAILAAWQVDRKPRLFYFLMLVLYGAQIGVFVAQDILLLFVMWELELVPVYLLVSIWGGQKRRYAATKFILYTAAASVFILIAGLTLALSGEKITFNITELGLKDYPVALEILLYGGLLVAFGVKLAVFPLHTWLPDAHGEASSPVSMILAGVLLKMGGYGLIRLNMGLFPEAHVYFAPLLVVLGVVNIVYGGFASFGQTNMKRRLAYSSVSHMGFVLIGIASFSELGISGAMLQMLSHGLIAALLFFLAGVTYDRTHTMYLDEMGNIGKVMPRVFALFTAGAMASLALPGMSGFVSELSVFLGFSNSYVYDSHFRTVATLLSAVGLIITPIYLLSMLRQLFYGNNQVPMCHIGEDRHLPHQDNEPAVCFGNSCVLPEQAVYEDAKPREIFIALCFLVLVVGIGLCPKVVTSLYDATTVAVNERISQSYLEVAENRPPSYNPLSLVAESQ
ncbi:MAG: NAD(P)H-quinone oxidoreductase subunit 4 [Geminocystis sp.]|nr:NAD(P)H-quinone oxidoreductase subunit 4 [Geminocystis sp.]